MYAYLEYVSVASAHDGDRLAAIDDDSEGCDEIRHSRDVRDRHEGVPTSDPDVAGVAAEIVSNVRRYVPLKRRGIPVYFCSGKNP